MLAKFALALILFFPAAFFMGGTLPVMTQYLVRNPKTLGKRASTLYAINTIGAASGAIAAGFYLPENLGIKSSYFLAMAVTLLVGLAAVALGRTKQSENAESIAQTEPKNSQSKNTETKITEPRKIEAVNSLFAPKTLIVLASISGFASLALQVLWIRMFAQVLHNSVYTYSAILSTFLVALALGGAIARELARRQYVAHWVLPSLLTLTGLLIGSSPLLFYFLTDGASYIGGNDNFAGYLVQIFSVVFIVMGVPTIALGVLLPYLFKLAENANTGPVSYTHLTLPTILLV